MMMMMVKVMVMVMVMVMMMILMINIYIHVIIIYSYPSLLSSLHFLTMQTANASKCIDDRHDIRASVAQLTTNCPHLCFAARPYSS